MDQAHPPGEGSRKHYQRGCRCPECRDANTAYMRERRGGERGAEHAELLEDLADDDPGILDGAAAGPAWWDQITAARLAAGRAEQLGVREVADDADGGRECPTCSAPMRWAGGYTALVCGAHKPGAWARPAVAEQRARARLEALEAKAGTRIPPAEAAEVATERAVAADRIDGYLEQLARIPRSDRYRETAVRARHYLEQLAAQFADARSYDDLDAAEDRETRLIGRLDDIGLLHYAEQLAATARRPALAATATGEDRPRGLLRFFRRADGDEWEYDGDDDETEADDDAEDQGAPPCEPCAAEGADIAAEARITLPQSPGRGIDVCARHRLSYGPGIEQVTSYRGGEHLAPLIALPYAHAPTCGICRRRPAVVRLEAIAHPSAMPLLPADVCPQCRTDQQSIADRQSFQTIRITGRYAAAIA